MTDEEVENIRANLDTGVTVEGARCLVATIDHYKRLWQRSNEVAEEYRDKCIEMQELHKKICEAITQRAIEAVKDE